MKKVEYSYSSDRPLLVQPIGGLFQINFDAEQMNIKGIIDDSEPTVQYKSLYTRVSELSYAQLVSAIVSTKYDSSDTEAILLNYQQAQDADSELTAEKRAEYKKEYQLLQAWRAHAKEVAKQCME